MVFDFDESKKDLKNDLLVEFLVLIVFVVVWGFAGFFSLTAGRALEEEINLTKWSVFAVLLVFYALYVFIVKFVQFNGKGKMIYVPLHDPEKGVGSDSSFFKNPIKLFAIFFFITVSMGLFSSLTPQSAVGEFVYPLQTGVGELQEQVTPSGKLMFGVFNAPAENFYLYVILSILVTLEFAISKFVLKIQDFKMPFIIMIIPNMAISSFTWLQMHALVSGDSQINQLSHFIFGAELSGLVLLTGSIIPSELLHIMNNLFVQAKVEFGTQISALIFGGLLVLEVVVIGFYYMLKNSAERRG